VTDLRMPQVPKRSSGERSCDAPPSSSCTTGIFRDLYLVSEGLDLQCVGCCRCRAATMSRRFSSVERVTSVLRCSRSERGYSFRGQWSYSRLLPSEAARSVNLFLKSAKDTSFGQPRSTGSVSITATVTSILDLNPIRLGLQASSQSLLNGRPTIQGCC
jgi:hypothetical protein